MKSENDTSAMRNIFDNEPCYSISYKIVCTPSESEINRNINTF